MIEKESETPVFSKEQFLKSKQFTDQQKDLLAVLLAVGTTYTTEQVIELLNNFLKKEVI